MLLLKVKKIGLAISLPFCICACATHINAVELGNGRVQGLIQYEGRVPISSNANNEGVHPPLFQLNPDNNGLPHAAVYLLPLDTTRAFPLDSTTEQSPEEFVEINQNDLTFIPHVTTIQAGTFILFTNSDPENHNVRALAENKNNKMNIVTTSSSDYDKRFHTEPGLKPIRLACDIHPWMRGWIFVFDYPFFAVTDANGKFSVKNVPPGNYRINAYQPDGQLKATSEIRIQPREETSLTIRFSSQHIGGKNIPTFNKP